jgi:hypothetical protein
MDTPPGSSFSKEIEIALLCSGTTVKDKDLDRVKYLCTQGIDWSFLKDLIVRNRVYVIVYHNLKLFKESLPEGFLSELKELVISTGTQNFMFTVFLQRLIAGFTRLGIFILPFKGPVLAEHIYKDIIFRPFSDLDVLVDKSDAVAAFNLLKNRGLTPQFELSPSQFKKYINDEDHFSFCEPQKKITIELHWDMSGLYLSRPITVSGLKNHIISGTLNNASIPCLTSEALLLYLCVHGAKHGWEHLEQICCITEILNQNPDLDWEKIIKLSSDWQCRNMLFLGLCLAGKLFKAPLPDHIRLTIYSDKTILNISDKITGHLFNNRPDQKKNISDRFSSFHTKIRDTYIDKIRYALRLLFRPTDKDWLYFPVPAYLSFVHYFLRPGRLLFCKLRGKDA